MSNLSTVPVLIKITKATIEPTENSKSFKISADCNVVSINGRVVDEFSFHFYQDLEGELTPLIEVLKNAFQKRLTQEP